MENQTPTNSSTNGIWKASTAVFALITGLLGYLLFDSKTKNESQEVQINQRVEELSTTRTSLDSISSQLDAKITEIQSLGGKVEELEAAKAQLLQDFAQLKKTNGFSKKAFDAKIAEYVNLLAAKDVELEQLKKENGILTEKNQTLTKENSTLNTQNKTLSSEKAGLADSVDNYNRRNRILVAQVTRASALHAQFVQALAISDRGKERDGGVYRASKMDKIKVVFQLSPNNIAKQDSKLIYLRLLDPDGATISDGALGSGTFTMFGKETTYTTKKEIQFTNTGQGVEMIYGRGGNIEYRAGHYAIELYSEGFKIGEGSFEVK
jgi:FtsZ-binding cell division protein ZapB